MARISAYPKHLPVQPEDYWIGTRASNLMTRNFTAEAVGEYINITGTISISACMLYKFEVSGASDGDITGVPNLTPFSNITSLNINAIDISGQNTVGFLDYIVGTEILISEQNEISTFGHYKIDSYTQIGVTTFYTLNLTFIGGSGYIEKKKIYDTCSFVLASEDLDTTYELDSIQNGPNSDIRLIGSDLTENIVKLEAGTNVTLTDTGNNILIDVSSVGTVTSIDASIDGDSLSVAGVPITSSGTIVFNWEGTNLQYVDGEGNLQTFPTLPTGTVTSVGQTHAGNAFSVTGSPITTAGVLAIGLNGNATQYIDGAGDLQTFPAIPVVPSNIVETLDTTNGTYIDLTPTTPTTGDVVVTAELSAIDGNAAAGERYLTKTNLWAEISTIPGTYEWEIQGDTGGPTVVNSTNIVTFVGGTNVSTALVGTTLTIDATDTNTTYDLTVPVATTDITLLGSDASFDSVTLTGGTNITVTRVSATELSIDGTDLNTTYNLEGVGSVDGTAGVRLAGSDASNDDVLIIGGGTTTVTRSLNTLTVTSNDQFDGTVKNVSASTTGDALDVAVTNPTTTPDLDFTWAGTASQYVDGQGDLQTFPAIPTVGDGTLTVQGTGVLGGTGTFTANQAGNTTISVTHDSQAQTNTTPSTTLTHGGTFTALSSNVGVNSSGHVTGQELTTFTLPTIPTNIVETFSNNNTGVYVAYGVTNSLATGDVSIGDVDLTAVDGTAIAGERYLTKSNTWATVASIPGTYSWILAGDSGSESVLSGDTISFIGGTNVTTSYDTVSNQLTINSTDQFQGTVTSVATTHAGNAFTASIGGLATVNPSVDITMNGSSVEYVDGAGNLQTFPAIPQGDITDVEGGNYITTINSTGPIVTVDHDLTNRSDSTSTITTAAGDTVTAVDSVTTNTTGHVTGLNLKSIILPTASESSETIDIQVKNISSTDGGINLSKGDPVYIYGSVGASARLYVDLADADSTATNNLGDSKMPCVALLDQDLAPNIEGTATVVGKLRNLITNPIDGDVPSENDTVYVKPGGGLTLTKPTGSTNLIQNVGQVGRVSTSADGNIVVAALLRTNDVPNLPEGRLFVGTSANTSLVSDVVYVDDTNDRVGIGTTIPGSKLTVDGSTRLGGDVEVSELLSGDKVLTLTANTGSFAIGDIDGLGNQAFISGDSSSISISTNQITTLHCDSNNRVGIGTTSPNEKLEVAGSARITGNGLDVGYVNNGTNFIQVGNGRTTNGYAYIDLVGDATYTDYGFRIIRNNTGPNTSTELIHRGTGIFNFNATQAADITFKTSNAERIRINSSGNVGIGTTSLTTISSAVATLSLGSTSATTSGGIAFQANGVVKAYNYVSTGYLYNQTVAGIGQIFFGAGSERMRIHNNTGNVGIGTTNPAKKLTIGGIGLGNTDGLKIEDPSNTAYGAHYSYNDGSTTVEIGGVVNNVLRDCISIARDATRTITINTSENVGIGTTNPQAKLHVANGTLRTWSPTSGTSAIFESTASSRNFVTLTAANEAELWFGNATTQTKGRIRYEMAGDNMEFWTNATQKMVIEGAGNVGIGIDDPSHTLEVKGTVQIKNGTSGYLYLQNTNNFLYGDQYGNTIIRSANNFRIQTKTGGGESIRVNSSGNVGIGTTVANVRLEIGGGSTLARVIPSINNQGYIGDSQHRWQAIYATNGTIQTSDIREKTEIKPTELGLDFINDLKPVSYKWIEGERLDASKDERNHQGLIAQEVAETLEKHGIDKNKFGGLDIQKTDEYDDFHAMSYEQLIAPMIKAIQELKTEIEELKKQINK